MSTPASKLRLRSGFRFGLSVNAISNASGGRMPVPALACTRVSVRPSPARHADHAAVTRGFVDHTTSSGNAGRGENGSGLSSSAERWMRSTRSPAVMATAWPEILS